MSYSSFLYVYSFCHFHHNHHDRLTSPPTHTLTTTLFPCGDLIIRGQTHTLEARVHWDLAEGARTHRLFGNGLSPQLPAIAAVAAKNLSISSQVGWACEKGHAPRWNTSDHDVICALFHQEIVKRVWWFREGDYFARPSV